MTVVVLAGFVAPIVDLNVPPVIFITGTVSVVASSPSRIL